VNRQIGVWNPNASDPLFTEKVLLFNNTLTFGDVLLGNITFLNFAIFDVSLLTFCINCSFFYIYYW